MGTRNSPATYYIAHSGEPAGFEHDLVVAFSQSQNWSLNWTEKSHPAALFELLDTHQIHLAAAALSQSVVKDRHLIAGPVLFETPVHIVVRATDKAPRNFAELSGKHLALIIGSGHTPLLMRQKRRHPGLAWAALENVWPEELLAQLQAAVGPRAAQRCADNSASPSGSRCPSRRLSLWLANWYRDRFYR